jgi:hypothetical protein
MLMWGVVVDLMAPNLNRDKMAFKAQAEREAQKKASNERRDRNRLALEKQRWVLSLFLKPGAISRRVEAAGLIGVRCMDRSDAANAKADKQKKAAKQERRG